MQDKTTDEKAGSENISEFELEWLETEAEKTGGDPLSEAVVKAHKLRGREDDDEYLQAHADMEGDTK